MLTHPARYLASDPFVFPPRYPSFEAAGDRKHGGAAINLTPTQQLFPPPHAEPRGRGGGGRGASGRHKHIGDDFLQSSRLHLFSGTQSTNIGHCPAGVAQIFH